MEGLEGRKLSNCMNVFMIQNATLLAAQHLPSSSIALSCTNRCACHFGQWALSLYTVSNCADSCALNVGDAPFEGPRLGATHETGTVGAEAPGTLVFHLKAAACLSSQARPEQAQRTALCVCLPRALCAQLHLEDDDVLSFGAPLLEVHHGGVLHVGWPAHEHQPLAGPERAQRAALGAGVCVST